MNLGWRRVGVILPKGRYVDESKRRDCERVSMRTKAKVVVEREGKSLGKMWYGE